MIDSDGWLDWAERKPGPSDKKYSHENAAIGYVPHSMVGYYGGAMTRLMSQQRTSDGSYTSYASASWHLSILYDGQVIQHYPLTVSCWASGSYYPNTNFIAAENEGGPPGHESEPLRAGQVEENRQIIAELVAWKGWRPRRPTGPDDMTATLYEHNECTRFGSAPTACPSGRIPWDNLMEIADGGESMTAEQLQRLERLERLLAGNGIKLPDGMEFAGDKALAFLDAAGVSMMQYIYNQDKAMAALIDKAGREAYSLLLQRLGAALDS